MIKTVLVPGAPWPKKGEKVETKKRPTKSILEDHNEFIPYKMQRGVFMHLQQLGKRRTQIFKPPVFDPSMLDDARKQLENFETRRSVRKGVEKNLKGKKCQTTSST